LQALATQLPHTPVLSHVSEPVPFVTVQDWVAPPVQSLNDDDESVSDVPVLVLEDEAVVFDPDVVDARDESVGGAMQVKEGLPLASATVVRYWPVAQIGIVMQ
jgi:hypothetical protein